MRKGVSLSQPDEMSKMADAIKLLQKDVERLKNNRGPTVPQYDPDDFPQQNVQGQIAIAHPSTGNPKTAWAYDNDNGWWQIGSPGSRAFAHHNASGSTPMRTMHPSGGPVYAGLGYDITPVNTGTSVCAIFVASFTPVAHIGGDSVRLGYGTGTPPSVNTTATGAPNANGQIQTWLETDPCFVCLCGSVSAVVGGTPIWFDIIGAGVSDITLYTASANIFEV